ncbi:MAG: hypothetical protein R2752_05470 [Vicinamibacterales bacterium]
MSNVRRVTVVLVLLFLVALPASAAAQSRPRLFQGLYAGLDVGRQNIIGGALVGGVDTLAQASRATVAVPIGARLQLPIGLVVGAEFAFGFEDGDLRLEEPGLTVDYRNGRHRRLGGTLGYVVGAARRTLILGYVSETTRTFDVTIATATSIVAQRDEQGLLRYGLGAERHLVGRFSLRATVGSSRADFGGRRTNITPMKPLDVSAGIYIRF